jgi:integrase
MIRDNVEMRRNPKTHKVEYRVAYEVKRNGKWQGRRTGWCSSEEAAKNAAARAGAEVVRKDKRAARRKASESITTLIAEYLSWVSSRPLDGQFSASTRRGTITRWKTIKQVCSFTNLTAASVNNDDVRRWAVELEEYVPAGHTQTISAYYFNSLASELDKFIVWLNLRIPVPLTARLPRKKKAARLTDDKSPEAKKWAYYKLPELNRLLNGHLPALDAVEHRAVASDGKDYLTAEEYGAVVIYFLFYTGLRFEELRALQWKDIQFGDHAIHIERANNYRVLRQDRAVYDTVQATKTRSSARVIPMYPQVEEWLRLLFNARTMHAPSQAEAWAAMVNQLVFPSYRNPSRMMTPHGIQHWLDEFAAEQGMPRISIHGLRHSCAEWQCWYRGMPKEIAKLFFGHSDTSMLDRVYAVGDQEKRANVLFQWEAEKQEKSNNS